MLRDMLRRAFRTTDAPTARADLEFDADDLGLESAPEYHGLYPGPMYEAEDEIGWDEEGEDDLSRAPTTTPRRGGASVSDTRPAVIEQAIYDRFIAYAEAAWPNEIGGILRCVPDPDGGAVRVVDMRILPQQVTSVTFDLDEQALAAFMLELATTGRRDEIHEWSGLIHSHPRMEPFLSGRDRENIIRLAGDRHAWSVICSVWPDRERNYPAIHYHQAQPAPMTVTHYPLVVEGDDAGLDEAEREAIADEVEVITRRRGFTSRARW